MIGDSIEITILEVKGEQIKIGISAPKDISVYRKEIYLEIQEENKKAASLNNLDLLKTLKNKMS